MQHNATLHHLVMFTAILVVGCATDVGPRAATSTDKPASSGFTQSLGKARDKLTSALRRATPDDGSERTIIWNWASGIPVAVPRADVVSAWVPAAAVAQIAPQAAQPSLVQLASTHQHVPLSVANVQGETVGNFADLHRAQDQALQSKRPIQVDLNTAADRGRGGTSVSLDQEQFVQLVHATATDSPVMRVNEDGNPWVLIRHQGVSAKVTVRVERGSGLVQLILSTRSFGETRALPLEVRLACNDVPLQCLTVADALDTLYGEGLPQSAPTGESASFAFTSERDDYLIPTNYKRLEQAFQERTRHASIPTAPAFLSLRGIGYPGSPVLGDTRALTAFLLQRRIGQHNRLQEETGWIIFGGAKFDEDGRLDLDLDLGAGPVRLAFHVPAS